MATVPTAPTPSTTTPASPVTTATTAVQSIAKFLVRSGAIILVVAGLFMAFVGVGFLFYIFMPRVALAALHMGARWAAIIGLAATITGIVTANKGRITWVK